MENLQTRLADLTKGVLMKELLITIAVLISFNLISFSWAKSLPTKQSIKKAKVVKEIKQSLVVIHLPDGSGGSGVIIKSNKSGSLVLTAKHVCDGAIKTPEQASEFRSIDFHLVKKHSYIKSSSYSPNFLMLDSIKKYSYLFQGHSQASLSTFVKHNY